MLDKFGYSEIKGLSHKHKRLMEYAGGGKLTAALRNARVSQHGSPAEKSRVRAAVHRKYPGIGQK